MNKAYVRIVFKNYPDTSTPLNDVDMNKIDLALDTIDDRVVAMDTSKADEADLLTCVSSITFNSSTGILTITLKNGTSSTIDTGLAKLAVNFDYDDDPTSAHYQQLVLEMKDGTYKYIDLSALLTQYEFKNSSTIAMTVDSDGAVSADVINGSITGEKLQPNYLADIRVESGKAEAAATSAEADATLAESWAVGGTGTRAGEDTNNAKYWSDHAGNRSFFALDDVDGTGVQNGDVFAYDSASQKLKPTQMMSIVQIPVPTVTTYTYNGSIQTFQFDSVDTQHIIITGDSQSQAGIYTVTATLKSAHDVWSDLTNAPKTFSWTINKAQGSFSLDSHSVVVNSGTPTATVNVSSIVGDGAITATSADDSVATASYSMGVVTITAVGNGSTTITVTMAESSNYLGASDTISAASSANITVTLTLNGAKEDNITIKDLNDVTVGTCIFATGQTSGTCQVTIPANGGTYKFISSVAKALDGSNTNFSKNVTLTNSLSQTVNVFPDVTSKWYGNNVTAMASSIKLTSSMEFGAATLAITEGSNYTSVVANHDQMSDRSVTYLTDAPIDVTNLTYIKAKIDASLTVTLSTFAFLSLIITSKTNEYAAQSDKYAFSTILTCSGNILSFNGIVTLDVSQITGNVYVGFGYGTSMRPSGGSYVNKNNISALWGE